MKRKIFQLVLGVVSGIVALPTPARAIPFPLSPAAFVGDPVIDFGPILTFQAIDGLTIGGVTFGFTIGGMQSFEAGIDGGPGNTNNITIANVEGSALGVLSLLFPTQVQRVGYGFALSTATTVTNATTVQLFDALNNSLGSLSFNGSPDPFFTGGFAGVGNDVPFSRAEVTFAAPAPFVRFAFDNLQYGAGDALPVPEPGTLLLFTAGMAAVAMKKRRRA